MPGRGGVSARDAQPIELGLTGLLRRCADERKPLLGICLGMQLLFDRSEELEPTDWPRADKRES